MNINYSIDKGVIKIKTNTRKYIAGAFGIMAITGAIAVPAMAAKPADPGCFGTDRAAYLQNVAQPSTAAPGGSEAGHILADRAGDNGTINRAYICTL